MAHCACEHTGSLMFFAVIVVAKTLSRISSKPKSTPVLGSQKRLRFHFVQIKTVLNKLVTGIFAPGDKVSRHTIHSHLTFNVVLNQSGANPPG